MPLAGSFDVFGVDEVLGLLAKHSCNGRLHVRTGSVHTTVRLVEGQAVGEELSGESGRKWRALLEDVCFDALRTGRGTFEFIPDEPNLEAPSGQRVKLQAVISAAERRLAEWREVQAVVTSIEAVPHLTESLKATNLNLDKQRWRVVSSIDGRRTVAGLARKLGLDLLQLCLILKPLIQDGAVTLDTAENRLKSLPSVKLEPGMSMFPYEREEQTNTDEDSAPENGSSKPVLIPTPRPRSMRRTVPVTGQA